MLGASFYALKEARTQKSTLATIWLDIVNACGSIPHKLIVFALYKHGVSPQWIRLVKNYYKGTFSKSFSEFTTSVWHRHQWGIFASCTLSIILLLAGMNIILQYSLQVKVRKSTTNNTKLLLLSAFTDDVSLMSSMVSEAQTLLSWCTTALNCPGLEFRADKSGSIIIVKGRSMNSTPFSVSKVTDQPEPSSSTPCPQDGAWIHHHFQGSKKNKSSKDYRKYIQTTTEQLMTHIPCPKLSNYRFRVTGQDG